MQVQKRNGNLEDVSFDKILARISSMSTGSEFVQQLNIDATKVAQKVIQEIFDAQMVPMTLAGLERGMKELTR